jgi:hypothetical protein
MCNEAFSQLLAILVVSAAKFLYEQYLSPHHECLHQTYVNVLCA